MKDKPNEWIAISDLMAGVMAVVMLLLVMFALKLISQKQEMQQGVGAQKRVATKMLEELQLSLKQQGTGELASFDVSAGKIILRDSVFDKGSACITPLAKEAIKKIEARIAPFLSQTQFGQVIIEGHTDSLPVSRPVIDLERFCTVYDDNFTLSAARAREARRLLVGDVKAEEARRIVVAGYGDSHPLPGIAPEDARNRRVEIHFLVQDQVDK